MNWKPLLVVMLASAAACPWASATPPQGLTAVPLQDVHVIEANPNPWL